MTKAQRHARKRPKGEDAARTARATEALDLRIAGHGYRQTAALLGVSLHAAWDLVQRALGEVDALNKQKAERLRDLEARRCDRLLRALDSGVNAGDPRAVAAMVRVMERRARLFGLAAPSQITGPEGDAVPIRIVHREVRA